MIRFLLSRFVYRRAHGDGMETRTQLTFFAGILGILCNLFLFALKLVIGMLAGSVAITSDAFNNLSDAGSSLVAAISARLAGQKPDAEHPWGHGRLEYIASLIVSFLILFVGVELLRSSFSGLFSAAAPTFSPIALILLGASVLVKLWMWSYNRYIASLTDAAAAKIVELAAADQAKQIALCPDFSKWGPPKTEITLTAAQMNTLTGQSTADLLVKTPWEITLTIPHADLAVLAEDYETLTLRVNRDETFAILTDGEEVTLPGATTAEKVPETQPTEPVELITEAPQ